MTFEELKIGTRFRISGDMVELIKHPKTIVEIPTLRETPISKLVNAEYVTGPLKNELVEILPLTKVRKIKVGPVSLEQYKRLKK